MNNAILSPKVSIIVPIYNAEKYLPKCLDSIITQSINNIEIICINDGSTDDSLDILKKYATKDARIKLINQINSGQSVARNKGLDIATGDYIYFVDADDYIHPQTLEIMLNVALASKCPIVATNLNKKKRSFSEISASNIKYSVHKKPLSHILNKVWSSSVIWNKLYKAETLKDWRFIEGIYFEDWPFISCLFSNISQYATIPQTLYYYNNNDYSTVRSTFTVKKLEDYVAGITFTHQYFQSPDKIKHLKDIRKKRISASVKMMINKVRREPTNHEELVTRLIGSLMQLHQKKMFRFRDLPFKSVVRFLKMYLRGY